ncbi:MAG: hypothetical protein ACTSQY_01625 [Candidatus Odinarchaeia archaeon]
MENIAEISKYAITVSLLSIMFILLGLFSNVGEITEDTYENILNEALNSALIVLFLEQLAPLDLKERDIIYTYEKLLITFGAIMTTLRKTFNIIYKEEISKEDFEKLILNNELDSLVKNKIKELVDPKKLNSLLKSYAPKEYKKTCNFAIRQYKLLSLLIRDFRKSAPTLNRELKIHLMRLSDELNLFLSKKNLELYETDEIEFIVATVPLIKQLQATIDVFFGFAENKYKEELFMYLT